MTIDQVRQHIKAHELAADRNPNKRPQHLMAARLYREVWGLPEPVTFGRDAASAHRRAMQRLETARINAYKRRGVI
jgi:hypothetical protein